MTPRVSSTMYRTFVTRKALFLRGGSLVRCFFQDSGDTVFALSSGQGKAGVAVVRISGPQSSKAVTAVGKFPCLPKPRKAILRKLIDPISGSAIDHGLVLWFPGPNSFTGEDSVEFQVHGGSAVVAALLNSLSKLPGFRHAEPGDFTKRALFNGKLDLTEVEGLADLIHAETESQRKQALRQMEGDLGKLYSKWSHEMLKCVAHVEATIDFSEEENIEDDVIPNVIERISSLKREIKLHLDDGRKGERLRSGVNVAILGAPNVGKSSLLNILCQRPAAIVSEYAGTTRDVIESSLDMFGYPIVLSDTAGLRDITHPIEKEGIKRAIQKGEHADLKILLGNCDTMKEYISQPSLEDKQLTDFTNELLNAPASSFAISLNPNDTIIVMNKTDLCSPLRKITSVQGTPVCWISCKTLDGMDSFFDVLKKRLEDLCGNPLAGSPRLTHTRHRSHLEQCLQSLDQFLDNVPDEAGLVCAAEDLKTSLRQLGRITGKVGIEEILDVVFRDFCIGK